MIDGTVSAPGKLFLFGEYAVLAQGLSLVTSVNRRVEATTHEKDGYMMDGQRFDVLPQLAQCVLEQTGASPEQARQWQTTTDGFFEGDRKLGLGSSAASTVALTCLARQQAGAPFNPSQLFNDAMHAHLALQNGRGSGADVAAACYGGTLAYRRQMAQAPFKGIETHAMFTSESLAWRGPMGWPETLRVVPVWLGEPAHSVSLIKQVEQAYAIRQDAIDTIFAHIHHTAWEAYWAFYQNDVETIKTLAARADVEMDVLGKLAGANIVTEKHVALRNHCKKHGVTTKPSGAGGGDFSLIFGHVEEDWDKILSGLPADIEFLDIKPHTFAATQHDIILQRSINLPDDDETDRALVLV